MHNENTALLPRRSSRVPVSVPILVSSLDGAHYSEVCETMVVNAHGCAIRSRARLDPGVALHFVKDGKAATAHVVSCQPMDSQSWRLGAKLDQPQNFWGLKTFPEDWRLPLPPAVPKIAQLPSPAPARTSGQMAAVATEASETSPQFSKEQVRTIIVDLIRPLHADVTAVKEKLARAESNRSRFDVSLSSIPPELEKQLEERLRQELSPKVIDEARQQSVRLLMATKEAIEQMAGEIHEQFQRESKKELEIVEQRASQIGTRIVESIREQLRDGVGDMQRKLADARNQLVRIGDDLLASLQTSLKDEHAVRQMELEKVRVEVAAESLRLHEQIEQLDSRTRSLDESVRSWESSLEERLERLTGDMVDQTRNELEGVAGNLLQELKTRSSQTLENQMEEMTGNMRIVQKGVTASVSESLKAQAGEALHGFEQSANELVQLSVERCRQKLAGAFGSVMKNLGEQFSQEA